jgi:hypothetical protein
MTAADLSEAAIWAWWCNQSAAQGLTPEIEPALIQRVAELARTSNANGAAATPNVPQQ